MIGIEARGSPLLDKGGLEGVPDQERVVFTVPNEHPELMGDGSLEGSTSPLSLNFLSGGTAAVRTTPVESRTSGFPAGFFSEPETSLQRPLS